MTLIQILYICYSEVVTICVLMAKCALREIKESKSLPLYKIQSGNDFTAENNLSGHLAVSTQIVTTFCSERFDCSRTSGVVGGIFAFTR